MAVRLQSILRPITLTLLCAFLLASGGSATPSQPSRESVAPASVATTIAAYDRGYYPIVHLRKLHLVRPDLIPYPIYYAVYC